MTPLPAAKPGVYDLPLPRKDAGAPEAQEKQDLTGALSEPLLLNNALWFCRLRWSVVAFLVAFGIACFFPGTLHGLGLRPPPHYWLFIAAAVLALTNLGYQLHARSVGRRKNAAGAAANLWAQIVADLLILTVVVHYVGSM